jgi:hypothetical protein
MISITQAKEHLTGMLHGGSLNKVRNIESVFERAANTMLLKLDPVDTIRTQPLSNTIHDDIFNYSLPSDYKKIIDLIPQDNRNNSDNALRNSANYFDVQKAIKQKRVSIEGSEGSKIIRINWRSRQGKILSTLNSLTDNGTWSAVGTASNLAQDTIFKKSGNGSIKFDVAVSGDGIQNTTLSAVDLTLEDEVSDVFAWFYVKNSTDLANINSVSIVWGNDLTANYWTGVAQTTQADGSAFQVGFNLIKAPWSTATETGTVDPETIDSAKITFDVDAPITQLRVDNILFSIGRNFDLKYYTKYIFQNSSGTLLSKPASDDDNVLLDNDAIQIWLLETLIACAQQIEGVDSGFDINWAERELYGVDNKPGLYNKYRLEYGSESKKAINYYGSAPARGRW